MVAEVGKGSDVPPRLKVLRHAHGRPLRVLNGGEKVGLERNEPRRHTLASPRRSMPQELPPLSIFGKGCRSCWGPEPRRFSSLEEEDPDSRRRRPPLGTLRSSVAESLP